MHHQTFTKLVDHPDRFTFKDAYRIAALIEVPDMAIIALIHNQYEADKKSRKKK